MIATMMAKGILSWIPGVTRTLYNRTAAAGTDSAAYCYGVWIKHLALLSAAGMSAPPRSVLELGPGASLGTGLAALLSGAERYHAIDALAHLRPGANLSVFSSLTALFRARAPVRPGFPPIAEHLDERGFLSGVLRDDRLDAALHPERLDRIVRSIGELEAGGRDGMLRYSTWDAPDPLPERPVDLLFSHVVLNQVRDLDDVYKACGLSVARGGWTSHQIDFSCFNSAREWNGHLAYGDLAWKVLSGRRPYFVNRARLGHHLALFERHGFDVIRVIRGHGEEGIQRARLSPRFRAVTDEDLATQAAFVIARKR